MNKRQDSQRHLIIGIVSVVALIAIIGGGYMYFANTNEPNGVQQQTPSNQLATDESAKTTEHKVMKPPITSDQDKSDKAVSDDKQEQPKDDANKSDIKPDDESKKSDSNEGSADK